MTRSGANGSAGRVLVVEDDEGIREMLKYNLVTAGFSVHEASDGASGLRTARTARPDLILLDLMLPGMSGFDFCRALRKSSRVPIIMITAKDAEIDKIVGLELGADDYITKPFSVREVLARVNAVMRRAAPDSSEPKSIPERDILGDFSIDHLAARSLVRQYCARSSIGSGRSRRHAGAPRSGTPSRSARGSARCDTRSARGGRS